MLRLWLHLSIDCPLLLVMLYLTQFVGVLIIIYIIISDRRGGGAALWMSGFAVNLLE